MCYFILLILQKWQNFAFKNTFSPSVSKKMQKKKTKNYNSLPTLLPQIDVNYVIFKIVGGSYICHYY